MTNTYAINLSAPPRTAAANAAGRPGYAAEGFDAPRSERFEASLAEASREPRRVREPAPVAEKTDSAGVSNAEPLRDDDVASAEPDGRVGEATSGVEDDVETPTGEAAELGQDGEASEAVDDGLVEASETDDAVTATQAGVVDVPEATLVAGDASGQAVTDAQPAAGGASAASTNPLSPIGATRPGEPPVGVVVPGAAEGAAADPDDAGSGASEQRSGEGNPQARVFTGAETSRGSGSQAAANDAAPALNATVSSTPAGPSGSDAVQPSIAPAPSATPPATATAAAADATLSSTFAQPEDAVNAARLSRGLNSAVNQGNGSVTLRLTPPELGTVRIQLQVQGTSVAAQFHAETDRGMTLLTQQLTQLRSSLEAHGLSVDRLGVTAMGSPHSAGGSNLNQQGGDGSPTQQQAEQQQGDGRSRGRFFQQRDPENQNPRDNRGGTEARRFDRLYHATRVNS